MSSGSRNLTLLGLGSIVIAIIVSAISLTIYHSSGDIYLDRSRPGFLPDKSEKIKTPAKSYTFSDSGAVDQKTLNLYLKKVKSELKSLKKVEAPYSAEPLTDKSLGIPEPDKPQN